MLVCGCEPASSPVTVQAPRDAWVGPYQGLFDDAIDPVAVGLLQSGESPAESPLLADRTKLAELVARMRLQTLSRDTRAGRSSYALTFEVGEPPFRAQIADRRIELYVAPNTMAFELVSSVENTLRGRTFTGFVRRFATAGGSELHWHLTADTVEVHQAVAAALAVEGFSDN